jgi:hypothetical protein
METVEQLLIESVAAAERFWFIRTWQITDRTNSTATVRLEIDTEFFVQVFLSERSSRPSLALIGTSGRLYGRDRERGKWHRHPFGLQYVHEATHEGMSSHPVMQFMAEVEDILLSNDLL